MTKDENVQQRPSDNPEDARKMTESFNAELKPLSFGQMLVGLNFNPSGDDKVSKAKQLCAELADLIHEDHKGEEATALYDELYHHTIGEILNAQMNVVKLLTLKY